MKRRQVIKAIMAGCTAPVLSQVFPNFNLAHAEAEEEPCPVYGEDYHRLQHNRYCNALVLSAAWQKPFEEAKSFLDTTDEEQTGKIMEALASARKKISHKAEWLCGEAHVYKYEQIESIAKYWRLDVDKSKAKVNTMLFNNESIKLDNMIQKAYRQFPPSATQSPSSNANPMSDEDYAVFQKLYSYCDAEVLAFRWNRSTTKAKANMLVGGAEYVQKELAAARKDKTIRAKAEELCYFGQQFTYQDVEKLSALWKTSIDRTKSKVSVKMLDGESAELRALLRDDSVKPMKGAKTKKVIRRSIKPISPMKKQKATKNLKTKQKLKVKKGIKK